MLTCSYNIRGEEVGRLFSDLVAKGHSRLMLFIKKSFDRSPGKQRTETTIAVYVAARLNEGKAHLLVL